MLRNIRKILPHTIKPLRCCSERVMVRFHEDMVKAATVDWVKSFVVRLGLCPWAAGELASGLNILVYNEGSVHDQYSESEYQESVNGLMKYIKEFAESTASSAMIVVPPLRSFEEFQMIHQVLEQELETQELNDEVQIATFHPQYQFEETPLAAPSNYTNRSPFPTFHLLRMSVVAQAIENYGDTDEIWKRNIATMEKLGSDQLLRMNVEILQRVVKNSKPSAIEES